MPENCEDPASAVRRAETGTDFVLLASENSSENIPSASELQAQFLITRFGVRPDRARLVASHVFAEARQ